MELALLAGVLTSLFLSEKFVLNDPAVTLSVAYPIIGSIWIGSSLGIFKKLALAEKRASPRIVSAFVFYITFALILVTPYLTYPSLAKQITEIAGDDQLKIDEKSVYYTEGRALDILVFFVTGLLFIGSAISICNAMQHPDLKQSQINILMSVMLPVFCFTIAGWGATAEILNTEGIIFMCSVFAVILLTNVLKMFKKTPFCGSDHA